MTALVRNILCICLLSIAARAEEPDDTLIIQRVLQTRQEILRNAADTNVIFMACWDFDGTILKGDCSEGLVENGHAVYPGLAQITIENGLSLLYPREGGFERFWSDYTNMDARVGHWLAYPFIPQMLRGARTEDVLRLSESHFTKTLSNYLMASSMNLIRALENGGVESHIVSASADLFVKGASKCVGIPRAHIHGIEVRTRDGQLTEELVYPITWNTGKLERIQQIVRSREAESGGKRVYVLAGFGDSFSTDGPFLKFIATQKLPAGKPISVFYGEGAVPAEYDGLFYLAKHKPTVSDEK
jgi:phosphoserine phosphatase